MPSLLVLENVVQKTPKKGAPTRFLDGFLECHWCRLNGICEENELYMQMIAAQVDV